MSDEYDEDDMDYYEDGSDEEGYLESPDTGDDDDEYDVQFPASDKGKQKSIEFQSLCPKQLNNAMEAEIQRIVGVSNLDHSVASILCRHYRWNVDKILDRYMESPTSVMKAIGEPDLASGSQTQRRPPTKKPRTPGFVCEVCFTNPEVEDVFKIRCGHKFCKDCWSMYVRQKVKDEGQCALQCMDEKCTVLLTDEDIKALTEKDIYDRYCDLLTKSFVKSASFLQFCPHPGCDQTVSCKDVTRSSLTTVVPIVTCAKAHNFCFGCDAVAEDHRPAICKVVQMWLTNAREDSGTSEWLKANTRPCPKCSQQIEKNGGCNRIGCRHCSHQFCWVCSASWDVHGYKNKSCNAFTEPEKTDPENQAKANLERWLFYFDRWNNHELSAGLDEKLFERAEEKITEVQDASGLSWIQAQFMKEAVEELTRCRKTLKWTYSIAFFLKPGNSKQIFEDIQADLEKAVEDLSQLLEEEIKADSVASLRQRMLDKTVYVQKRHKIVLEDTAKGLLDGRWEWSIPVE